MNPRYGAEVARHHAHLGAVGAGLIDRRGQRRAGAAGQLGDAAGVDPDDPRGDRRRGQGRRQLGDRRHGQREAWRRRWPATVVAHLDGGWRRRWRRSRSRPACRAARTRRTSGRRRCAASIACRVVGLGGQRDVAEPAHHPAVRVAALAVAQHDRQRVLVSVGAGRGGDVQPGGEQVVPPRQRRRRRLEERQQRQIGLGAVGALLGELQDRLDRAVGRQPEVVAADVGIEVGVQVVDLDAVGREGDELGGGALLGVRDPHQPPASRNAVTAAGVSAL
jgi:hypothetical protein